MINETLWLDKFISKTDYNMIKMNILYRKAKSKWNLFQFKYETDSKLLNTVLNGGEQPFPLQYL